MQEGHPRFQLTAVLPVKETRGILSSCDMLCLKRGEIGFFLCVFAKKVLYLWFGFDSWFWNSKNGTELWQYDFKKRLLSRKDSFERKHMRPLSLFARTLYNRTAWNAHPMSAPPQIMEQIPPGRLFSLNTDSNILKIKMFSLLWHAQIKINFVTGSQIGRLGKKILCFPDPTVLFFQHWIWQCKRENVILTLWRQYWWEESWVHLS